MISLYDCDVYHNEYSFEVEKKEENKIKNIVEIDDTYSTDTNGIQIIKIKYIDDYGHLKTIISNAQKIIFVPKENNNVQ